MDNIYDNYNKDDLLIKYTKIKEEFETYQNFAEGTIQTMNEKVNTLEKKLDALTNVVEVSKYINSYVSDDNLIPMINDMIIGIIGVTYSSIFLKEDNKYIIKATNIIHISDEVYQKKYFLRLDEGKPFVINCAEPLFLSEQDKLEIHSLIGVPIALRDKFIGYIIVEHTLCDFFSYEHVKFISSIANQIGIALENNFLYKKVKEASIKDPLLNIYNRRYFFNIVEKMITKLEDNKFAIVMIDFDNFKKANDVYGHQFGDEVLTQTVRLIGKNISQMDILARYGGEEIVLYVHMKDPYDTKGIFDFVDNIRLKISENIVEFGNIRKSITASFGLSFYPKDGVDLESVISVADLMLYEAKKNGKNMTISSVKTVNSPAVD